jgi:HEAT repeat protein
MLKPFQAVLIALGCVCVAHAREKPNAFDPEVAVPKAWSLLTAALDATDLQEQLGAVSALTIADTPRALDVFEHLAQTGTAPVRSTALWFLPSSASRNSLALVIARLNDPDLSVRRGAIERLALFRDSQALSVLQDVIAAGDENTIEWAVSTARVLGSLGIGPLLHGMESGHERAVVASIRTLDVLLDPMFSSASPENLLALRAHRQDVVLAQALQHRDGPVRIFGPDGSARALAAGGVIRLYSR